MAEIRMDKLLINVEGLPKIENKGLTEGINDDLPVSEEHWSDDTYSDYEGQKLSCGSLKFECDDVNASESCLAPDTSHLMDNNREGEPSVSELTWLEGDESLALWVKWRGKWQAGVRCARADWPLATLRAKPTHDRKNYFVIFFPHTRNYSWADTLLVRPVNEFPEPIAHKTHRAGLKMVRDLNIARRFIMKKLAVGLLNFIEQLPAEALIECARDVMSWKDFAMEVSRCNGYCDLGRMLLKLQNMILPRFINSDWFQHSLQSWAQQCQDSQSAETIELLKEELFDSILWTEINSLRDGSMNPILCSEWKTWKHEVLKWFSLSGSLSSSETTQRHSNDSLLSTSQQLGRKRPKLEIRRAEPHSSQVESKNSEHATTLQIDSEFFNSQDGAKSAVLASESCKEEASRDVTSTDSPINIANKWNEIVVETANLKSIQPKEAEITPIRAIIVARPLDTGNRNGQCKAFIESKGRQCVRWANEGDVYCCVHLSTRFSGNSVKKQNIISVDAPMCQGTTVLGTKCKHRSLYGSSFCKKHGPISETKANFNFTDNRRKRKNVDMMSNLEPTDVRDLVLFRDVESPLQVDPLSVRFAENHEHTSNGSIVTMALQCIGSCWPNDDSPCLESPKRYSLYCEKHLPSWLKRARNGKSRIVSKEVFMELLKDCCTLEAKIHLHQGCELFYKLFKSILSLRNPVPKEVQFQWALSEASKNLGVKDSFIKLVLLEKTRLKEIWGFGCEENAGISPSSKEEPARISLMDVGCNDEETSIRCKICSEVFLDDQVLSSHFMDSHKKEAQWLFRGYACSVCLDPFTNKKVLESHVQERHHVPFVEQCMLIQCIPCGSHFGNIEQLWLHVLAVHPGEFRLSKLQTNYGSADEDSPRKHDVNSISIEKNLENIHGERKFVCRLCGLKFDLLPDLGRHHQAAHMGPSLVSSRLSKRGIRYYAYKMKSGRLSRPRFKKSLTAASYRIRNRANATIKKRMQASKLLQNGEINEQSLERLIEPQCSSIASILFSEIQKTEPHPTSFDILETARSSCCKISLKATLEKKYGLMPENLYLKAAKLCSENNVQVDWHLEGFTCPKGCKLFKERYHSPLTPRPDGFIHHGSGFSPSPSNLDLEVDECHYVLYSNLLRQRSMQKATILCEDISFGLESVPVVCVADDEVLDSLSNSVGGHDEKNANSSPWQGFTYVTKPVLDKSLVLDTESFQLGCGCPDSTCRPELCDHVYLFDNDFDDARDIYGKLMRGRFPYNDKSRIVLEEGYLVYECNQMCSCSRTCPNRVLQNGIRAKLEVFLTEKKGWAVRAGETILRGTFVCEYIGEILNEDDAKERYKRHINEGCHFFLDFDAHTNDISRLVEGLSKYVIDATKFGNVSRFINHSCSPNLTNHQVQVESMDYHRTHIGLYANRDIAIGEEITFNYRYKIILDGEEYPCYCGASSCRGRLY